MNDTDQKNNNRMVLLLIGGIPLTMILAATWLWYFVVRGDLDLVGVLGTANRGTLVQPPRQMDEQPLRNDAGSSITVSELEPRWSMVVPVAAGECALACEKSLYLTRQIHVAMGKDFNRLRRFSMGEHPARNTQLVVGVLSDGHPTPAAGDFAKYLATEHQGLQNLILSDTGFAALFPEHAADPSTWYLVDPAGWIMMSYNGDVSYKDVISDLKFLLKNSGG
jgi:hypothetical protein